MPVLTALVLLWTLPAQSAPAPHVWSRGESGCTEWLYQGMAYRALSDDGVRITVTLDDFGPALGAAVRLENLSPDPLPFDFRTAWVATVAPREMVLHFRSALLVSRAVARQPNWKLPAFLALDGLNPATANDSLQALQDTERETAVASAHVIARALEPGRIAAGADRSGYIFFDADKRLTTAILNLPVNGRVYAIPFTFR